MDGAGSSLYAVGVDTSLTAGNLMSSPEHTASKQRYSQWTCSIALEHRVTYRVVYSVSALPSFLHRVITH